MRKRGRRLVGGAVFALSGAAIAVYIAVPGIESPEEPEASVQAPAGRVKVEVLNLGGVSGMAGHATERLREVGFDVVDFRNADSFDASHPSEVIDRVGRTEVAQAVADALGIDIVHSEPSPNLYVDVSVLLGSEWARPSRGPDGEEGDRTWWDPRGWVGR